MWPVLYTLGGRFANYLVLPIAAVVGTVGYYAERKFFPPKQKPISYLQDSIQEQRELRQSQGGPLPYKVPDTLGVLKPRPAD